MFPVQSKSRIPCTESYPLKTSEVSEILADVPQAECLQIVFWRYSTLKERNSNLIRLVRVLYSRRKPSISTSNWEIEQGQLGPKWEIWISPVPKSLRHRINALLVSEGMPRIRSWLLARGEVNGRFGVETIGISYDVENDSVRYQ